MSLAKRNSRNKSGNHESSEDTSENVAVQTRHQSNTARSKKDSGTGHSNRSADKIIGKIAQTTTTNSRANNEKTRNSVQQKAVNNVDDEDDDDDDDDDNDNNNNRSDNNKLRSNCNEKRRGNDDSDDDEISQSGFSNGSSDERSNGNKHQKDGDESITNKATGKPTYEDDLVIHGRNDSVAMETQLIKGVLPDLFAVLKFLESDDDLVFNGIICRYFLKKLQVVESKTYEWWKRNVNAVRKSIDGRRASVSNLIKRSFMGTYYVHVFRVIINDTNTYH